VFRLAKGCHQDFNLLRTIILVIHHLFGTKVARPQCAFTQQWLVKKEGFSFSKLASVMNMVTPIPQEDAYVMITYIR
jgi:hypothetical protein